jgi:hypothetical protein
MRFSRRRMAATAFAAAALGLGGAGGGFGGSHNLALAADTALAPENDASTASAPPPADQSPFGEKYYPAIAPTRRRPLMSLLDRNGLADTLEDARINIFGYVEGSFEANFMDPAQDINAGRVFDFEQNKQFLFNQFDLAGERTVVADGDQWDIGGRVEILVGEDARFLHANGLGDSQDFFNGPDVQFDLLQAYADVAVPVGSGLRVRAGKFLFFKQVDPNASVFYTHSFTFGAALPYTLTGASALYNLSDEWSVEAGINRGWDQALTDNNGAVSFHGRLRHTLNDRTSYALMGIVGPEVEGDKSWGATFDFVISHKQTDQLTLLGDVVFGYQPDAPKPTGGSTDASWYGVAGYAVYRLNDTYSLGGRAEWYRDSGGFTTGVDQNLFELTGGVTITPFPHHEIGSNLKIRPELRYDYSTEDYFDGLTEQNQLTFAVDVIFNF